MRKLFTVTELRKETSDRPVRVYVDGVFDLCHYGHYNLFKKVKAALPNQQVYLIAGVHSDEEVETIKRRPIMSMKERIEAVKLSPYVDEVLPATPYAPERQFFEDHEVDLLAHDPAPVPLNGQADMYQWVKDEDRFLAVERTEGISTTNLICRMTTDLR